MIFKSTFKYCILIIHKTIDTYSNTNNQILRFIHIPNAATVKSDRRLKLVYVEIQILLEREHLTR
jgi:hypothetical protein